MTNTTTTTAPRYLTLDTPGVPVKAWIDGVPMESEAELQLRKTAMLPFVHSHLAVMPDVHLGIGATVGTVIPTRGAIVPAAVGVDIGCGMIATRTTLVASDLPDSLSAIRSAIEKAVPHGRADHGAKGVPATIAKTWRDQLEPRWRTIAAKHPKIARGATAEQLGTLGGGNHFVELCLDERQRVWIVLHSGSRGVGNRTGTYFIEIARREMERLDRRVPDRDLAYLEEGTEHFADYLEALSWAQDYAAWNRRAMMESTIRALKQCGEIAKNFLCDEDAVNCHHNYVAREHHYGAEVWVTRKGAVRAGTGELGIIPGSMGAKSYIVRGKGNPESFCSCSHGAGRRMSRSAAKRAFTVEDHAEATRGVECRKDADVIDETPLAYKDIDAVMAAQSDLVEIVHTLKQVVCVKG